MRDSRVMGKGSKERLVPLVGTARRVLGAYLARRARLFSHTRSASASAAVFLNMRGTRLSRQRPCDLQLRPYGGIELHPHTLRHSSQRICSQAVRPACPAGDLGACGYATTQIYTMSTARSCARSSMAHPRA
ncbi:MAG: tyrosine-type recombinase/integrase [Collinsella intestinalis]